MRKRFATLILSVAAAPAFAHPGEHHASLLATLWHLASEPDHLAMLALAAGVGAVAAFARRKRARAGSKR